MRIRPAARFQPDEKYLARVSGDRHGHRLCRLSDGRAGAERVRGWPGAERDVAPADGARPDEAGDAAADGARSDGDDASAAAVGTRCRQ